VNIELDSVGAERDRAAEGRNGVFGEHVMRPPVRNRDESVACRQVFLGRSAGETAERIGSRPAGQSALTAGPPVRLLIKA
jgi:hypothetical protein